MQPKIKPIDVTNAMFFWASLSEPNSFSKKFQVDVCQLTPEVIATLTALGVEVKDKEDERGKFVTAKNTNYPISAKMDGKELTKKVGNGSKGSTQLKPYYTKYGSVALNVNEITVKDLIEYNPNREEVTVDDDPL
jgi:hypothetical protein